jgi:hypothetical protein
MPECAANESPRIARQRGTIGLMVGLYCRAHHASAGRRCASCEELFQYAMCRLDRCPFASAKPTCAACPIHCYRLDMRKRVQAVMRYAGPRMLLRHPLIALQHQWDAWRSRRTQKESPKNAAT